jgi:hypothetical protein
MVGLKIVRAFLSGCAIFREGTRGLKHRQFHKRHHKKRLNSAADQPTAAHHRPKVRLHKARRIVALLRLQKQLSRMSSELRRLQLAINLVARRGHQFMDRIRKLVLQPGRRQCPANLSLRDS